MSEKIVNNFDEEKLKICINKLRDILNEMCDEIDETGTSVERLNVSQQLDKLIFEYMSLKNS